MQRREFISLLSAAVLAPFSEPSAANPVLIGGRRDRTLVLIELAGGCDGLNMVVPFTDPEYYRNRPHIALPRDEVLPFGEELAFHPALAGIKRLFDRGWVSVIHGVGPTEKVRTHFEACRHSPVTSLLSNLERSGWREDLPIQPPGRRLSGSLAQQLAEIARAIAGPTFDPVYQAVLEGFDTHVHQVEPGHPTRGRHADLLSDLSSSVCEFLTQVEALGKNRDVLVLVWTEFGRRLEENGRYGTDHGTAAPMLLIGRSVRGGSVGSIPRLSPVHLDQHGDLRVTADWYGVNHSLLTDWLKIEPSPLLAGGRSGLLHQFAPQVDSVHLFRERA